MTLETQLRKIRSKRARKQLYRQVIILLIGVFIGATTVAMLTLQTNARSLAVLASSSSSRIEEDDPRWDCRTMGDHYCGPGNDQGVPQGTYVTVLKH
jgi:hypothetical protein